MMGTMPESADAYQPTPTPAECLPASSCILLVDDEPVVRRVLAAQLVAKGLTVIEASNGRDALAALAVRRFDLLITDLQMPVMDGHELLTRVQEDYPLLRRIVITSPATPRWRTRSMR